jgi:hypothetical protein
MDYSQEQFRATLEQMDAERRQNETPDPDVLAAKQALEDARQFHLEEQDIKENLPLDPAWRRYNQEQRMSVKSQMDERIRQAKLKIDEAEKAVWAAENAAARKRREAQQEAEKAEKKRIRDEQAAAYSATIEAQTKAQFLSSWVAEGGTAEAFETAWPGLWKSELVKRTRARQETMQNQMRARYQM